MFLQKAWRTTAFGVYGFLHFTKSGFLEHSKRFRQEEMQAQLEGKVCIVTGANSGIGFATAEGLASRKERGEAALSKIQSTTGNKNVHLEVCDLSSVSEIKSLASRFSSKDLTLNILVFGKGIGRKKKRKEKRRESNEEGKPKPRGSPVFFNDGGLSIAFGAPSSFFIKVNNAGLLEHNRVTTSEGLELNFAVNVVGTYAMTELMVPLLQKAESDARVITVSSGGMYNTPLTKDLQFSESNFDGNLQYARNKRVQVALTEKWAETYKNKGIGFYSMHPGWAETPGVAKSLPGFNKALSGKLRTSEEGADTIIWLALQPKEKLVSGAFYFDRAEAPKHLPFAGTGGSHPYIDSIVDILRGLCNLS